MITRNVRRLEGINCVSSIDAATDPELMQAIRVIDHI